jgi:RNA polymerase sigma-70 factor (sigma-E family)
VSIDAYVSEHRAGLCRFAVVLCGDVVLAEDIVQDVLGRAFERWEQVSAATNVHAYVRRMVVNEYLGRRRRLWRSAPSAQIADLLVERPDHAAAHADRLAMIGELNRLPPRQRAVLVLRYYEDLDDADIARTLGCGQSTVRAYVARALATLRIDLTAASRPSVPSAKDL